MESTNPKQDERIEQAIALHRSGKLTEAADRMRELLVTFPGHSLLLAHLGTLYLQQGKALEGVGLLEETLRVEPSQFMALSSYSLGLVSLGRFNEALKAYDSMIALQPGQALIHNNRGAILHELKRPQEALASYDRAIALKPSYAEAHFNRAIVLEELERPQEALESYDHAITADPAHAWAHNNRGNVLREFHRPAEALESFDRAIALQPGYAEAHYNRANVLKELERPQEALESFDRAIAANPRFVEAYSNRGTLLKELHRTQEAFADLDRAIALEPAYAPAYFNKALLKILTGDYAEGWRLYEWRWKLAPKEAVRSFTQPLWTGAEPLAGKTLLIHAEQGLGDTIQFCRYAPMAEKLGAKIILEVPQRLVPVMATLTGNITVVEKGKPLPPFDLHCPMLSLPLAFKTELGSVPGKVPYLFADPDKSALWRKKLGPKSKPRVALAWSGKKDNTKDQSRSMSLENLRPLLELPFDFHSLQIEYGEKDLALLAGLPIKDHQKEQKDFSDTAALISEMDLVLSVDTSVAHLAGALGKHLWVMLSYTPDHRWMWDRPDSPWYPTATLFRQPAMGDWKTVVSQVVQRLQKKFLK